MSTDKLRPSVTTRWYGRREAVRAGNQPCVRLQRRRGREPVPTRHSRHLHDSIGLVVLIQCSATAANCLLLAAAASTARTTDAGWLVSMLWPCRLLTWRCPANERYELGRRDPRPEPEPVLVLPLRKKENNSQSLPGKQTADKNPRSANSARVYVMLDGLQRRASIDDVKPGSGTSAPTLKYSRCKKPRLKSLQYLIAQDWALELFPTFLQFSVPSACSFRTALVPNAAVSGILRSLPASPSKHTANAFSNARHLFRAVYALEELLLARFREFRTHSLH